MGTFAVLQPSSAPAFTVQQFHINLWCLWSFGVRRLTCDVGILVAGSDASEPTAAELWLPFAPDATRTQDLSSELEVTDTAEMVFNETTSRTDNANGARVLTFGDGAQRLALGRLTGKETTALEGAPGTHRCNLTWEATGQTCPTYVRVRFVIDDPGSTWVWKRDGGLRNKGALVDLRVADLRDGPEAALRAMDRLVVIESANLFVIAPWDLHVHASSPTPNRSRVLEGDRWVPYLGRHIRPRLGLSKAVVHHWKSSEARTPPVGIPNSDKPSSSSTQPDAPTRQPIRPGNEFTMFARLGRAPGITLAEWTLLALLVGVVVSLLTEPNQLRGSFTEFLKGITIWVWGVAVAIGGLFGISWRMSIRGVARLGKWVRALRLRSRRLRIDCESAWYR